MSEETHFILLTKMMDSTDALADLIVQMEPNDGTFTSLTCIEAEALAKVFTTAKRQDAASFVLEKHAEGDERGDQHWKPTWESAETDDEVRTVVGQRSFAEIGQYAVALIGASRDWNSDVCTDIAEFAHVKLGPDLPHPGGVDSARFWQKFGKIVGFDIEQDEEDEDA